MRTLRLSLAGMVILALLGGVGGAVLAQEGSADDVAEPVFVDITTTDGPPHDCSETSAPDGVVEVTCTDGPDHYIEASDPRLSGPVWGSLHEYGWGGSAISTEMYVIENEGGTWRGTRQVVEARETIPWQGKFYVVLSGEGGYEGLTAAIFYREDDTAMGAILPRPIPEPLEPAAE